MTKQTEAQLQAAVVQWLEFYAARGVYNSLGTYASGYAGTANPIFIFTSNYRNVPRAGAWAAFQGAKNRKSGVKAGWPDLTLHWRDGTTTWIELKSSTGKLNKAQKTLFPTLEAFGDVYICKSLEQVIEAVEEEVKKRGHNNDQSYSR